jgi:hypothetical protein
MGILDIFGGGGGTSPPKDMPVVKLAVIGTSSAGKTYLLNAILRLIFKGLPLKNGLRIGALNAGDTTVKFNEIEGNIRLMQKMPLPSTAIKYDFDFRLFHQIKPALHVVYHDNVGQILTDGDPKRNPSRNDFLKIISQANVVWLLLPMQVDKEGKYLGIAQKDILLAEGYLQDALQNRSNRSPLAFAILLTKADVLEDLEQESTKQELHSLHATLKARFEWLIGCDFISASALFPISTLGFGNAQLLANSDTSDEVGAYTLLGNDLKPYNVDKLLLWSLSCACYQNISSSMTKVDDIVSREILNNLQQLDGLIYFLKGGH